MKKHLALLLALLMLAVLAGCGYQSPAAGVYTCTGMEAAGHRWPAAVPAPAGMSIELYADGKGTLTHGEESGMLSWLLSGEALRIETGGRVWEGSLADGVIRLPVDEETGAVLVFERDAVEAPQPDALAYYNEWYGWWQIENSTGSLPNTWYDCCAAVEPGEDGLLLMTLWDEDGSRGEPMGRVELRFEDGRYVSESGYFWLAPLQDGEWSLDFSALELNWTGHHEAEGESFTYRFTLRPFGCTWGEDEERPYHYTDWYLPLLETEGPMPDSMK